MDRKLRNSLLLTLTALIWGLAFVAQSEGSNYISTYSFTGVRFLIASAVLLPIIKLSERSAKREGTEPQDRKVRAGSIGLWPAGIICGALLCTASLFQQEGIAQGTGAGKAGFLTAIYIVLVPLVNLVLFRKRTAPTIWISVLLALAGLYLLCVSEALTFHRSDLLVALCALIFAFHILAVDRFSPIYDSLKLAAIQFFTCGVIASALMIPLEIVPVGLKAWLDTFTAPGAWISLAYAAVLSSAIGYTLQIVGQKGLNPTVASLLMSLESVFAVLAGWLILHQSLTLRETVGAILVFVAVILAQIPERQKVEKQ